MGWTKRQFVTQAFEEIGLAAYVFDLTPEQLESALRRLDSMVASWNAKGIRLGYPIPSSPQNSELDQETNVPDSANEAIYLNLGIRLAPGFGKVVSTETKASAKMAYDTLLSRAAMPPQQQFPGAMPSGSGNKPWRTYDNPFLDKSVDPLLAGEDGPIEFN
ncbi:Tail accessory factor GP4 [uncultured Caudovirales phage]|uniref:Tail accessory factor GP4 n=1 Tax=uncultured Caudovirales phage TaxID=2100421 RepID=A0A6J5PIG7_9CAUD|nr:Tail accessory factor GP4 [uncultured Caudovirales phage]CAB4199693.1 Tail accessory factor GP4 [uncultured Caudovirales phage]